MLSLQSSKSARSPRFPSAYHGRPSSTGIEWRPAMTLCPVAIAVGCRKCPVFSVCPAKSLIGDYKPEKPRAGAEKKRGASKHKR